MRFRVMGLHCWGASLRLKHSFYIMRRIVKSCVGFLSKETVLCVAVILAAVSCFFVPPSMEYISYIDWDTLALLFSLMAVMRGFQKVGLFESMGGLLIGRVNTSMGVMLILVFLPFLFSMLVTNDVALVTFVPFGLIVLRMADMEKWAVRMVVLQTAAANLGSMLTPMGNPQNLYLYARSGMGFGEFCMLMLPYVLVSGGCILALAAVGRRVRISQTAVSGRMGGMAYFLCCIAGFAGCLLGIFKVIPPIIIAAAIFVFLLFTDRKLLISVDYSLLGTFTAFFIFIGNVGNIEIFKNFIAYILTGHVRIIAVLSSQLISNVPAALLLSGFTDQWRELIVGCNIGGLGTLIASMASLISYRLFIKEYPERRGRYFLWFTLCNFGLLAILLLLGCLFN